MKNSILIIISVVSILTACKKDECRDTIIKIKHFESDYGCQDTKHTLVIDLTNNVTVIRSKAEYDTKVTGDCHPDLDFALNDLVIGKQASGNWNDTITYDLKRICPEKELTLTVDIVQSVEALPDNVVYHAIIPKLGDEETLNINVNVR